MDCSRGCVPEAEESLFNTLVAFGPEVIELEEEPEEEDNLTPFTNVKEVGSGKRKGKGKRVASNQVSTRSYSKAFVQRTPTLHTIVVDCPTATPSADALDFLLAPSHSSVALPSCPARGRPSHPIPLQLLPRSHLLSL